jgi:Ni,Fe-hydrogenase maturation factor
MGRTSWTPSIVPNDQDQTVYLVVDDFGPAGFSLHETNLDRTDLESVISDLMSGQYENPVKVLAFNVSDRWAGDVSNKIAREIQTRADFAYEDLSSAIEEFVMRHISGCERQLLLRLA